MFVALVSQCPGVNIARDHKIIICVCRSVGCSCRAESVDHGALGLVEAVEPELGCGRPRLGLGLVLVRHLPFPRREAVLRGAHQRSSGQVTKQRTVNIEIVETLSLSILNCRITSRY